MAERFDVPVRRCSKGHVIQLNGGYDVNGIEVKNPRIACEICAIEAGGGEILEGVKHRPRLRGKKLEKAGQESFLSKVPAIFIAD